MNITKIYMIFILIKILNAQDDENGDNVQLENELNKAIYNSICCYKNLKCCNRKSRVSKVEIRAVLTNCSKSNSESKTETLTRKVREKHLTNCRKMLSLTLKLINSTVGNSTYEYIVVDHVYDPITDEQNKLLIPYVIKLKESVKQVYGLKLLHNVNSKVKENVYDIDDKNYKGPTCDKIEYNGKSIPYSEGFVCSCNSYGNQSAFSNNRKKHFANYNDHDVPFVTENDCPENLRGENSYENNKFPKNEVSLNALSNYIDVKVIDALNGNLKNNMNNRTDQNEINLNYLKNFNTTLGNDANYSDEFRKIQLQSNMELGRGGEYCQHQNPKINRKTVHCLRFSKIWYKVYSLKQPTIEHTISFQIFEKHEDAYGNLYWKNLTADKTLQVNNGENQTLDGSSVILAKYISNPSSIDSSSFSINFKRALLLISEPVPKYDYKKYPEVRKGSSEYLVIGNDQISLDGTKCNVAGVGFEAFFKQPNRCSRPQGSCLENQPYDLWRHDHEAEMLGKRGCYFLKFFGEFLENPIRRNIKNDDEVLVMKYFGMYSSSVSMEIRANFNTVLTRHVTGTMTEVYVDSTNPLKTTLTVKITNSGLISNNFMVIITECPLAVPAAFNNIESEFILIPPQHQRIFYLQIKYNFPNDKFYCTVQALNYKREVVAFRRVLIAKNKRCICSWHCLCACMDSSTNSLGCVSMSLEHYRASGFRGSLPVNTYLVCNTLLDDVLMILVNILFGIILLALCLGIFKALIGALYSPIIGILGLENILDVPKPIKNYYEKNIQYRKVVYDDEGWPVHPDTKRRVRSVSCLTEFCLNTIFFFLYPIYIIFVTVQQLCWPNNYKQISECSSTENVKPTMVEQNTQTEKKERYSISNRTASSNSKALSSDISTS